MLLEDEPSAGAAIGIAHDRRRDEQHRALCSGFSDRLAKKIARLDGRVARLDAERAAQQVEAARLGEEAERLATFEASRLKRGGGAASDLEKYAVRQISALAPVLAEAGVFREGLRMVAVEKRTVAERQAEAAAVRVETARQLAVNDDEWLTAYSAKQVTRSAARSSKPLPGGEQAV